MASIELCKTVPNKRGKKYTEKELSDIRERLYSLANLHYQLFVKTTKSKNGKCINIHSSEYRRAS